jgi:hypothetical protein
MRLPRLSFTFIKVLLSNIRPDRRQRPLLTMSLAMAVSDCPCGAALDLGEPGQLFL